MATTRHSIPALMPPQIGRRTATATIVAVVAIAACAASAPSPAAAPSPTLRPTLVSNDPAGDEGIFCYIEPPKYARDAPRATPAQCHLEVTDTLHIDFGEARVPKLLFIHGPAGFSKVVRDPELHIDVGMPVGTYRFEGAAGGREVSGGFTVRLSSKRIVQLRFNEPDYTVVDHLALAGYAPSSRLTLYRYDQVSFQPSVGTGTRTWRLAAPIRDVEMNERGEARVEFPKGLFLPRRTYLIVSDPMQQNSLNSATIIGQQ